MKKINIQGLNSGVVLLFLERMRNSSSAMYDKLISPEWISHAVQKYFFKVLNIYKYNYL